MAGYLEQLMNPATLGLLNLSSGLLQAGGPSRLPVSFGQALGQGIQQGAGAFQGAQQSQMAQEKLRQEAELLKLHGKLYEAQTGKTTEEVARLQKLAQIMGGVPQTAQTTGLSDNASAGISAPWAAASQIPQAQVNPMDVYKQKASQLVNGGFFKEGNELADFVKKMSPNLEFKDGVWYDKDSGKPVRGGAGVNQQGFGYQTNVGQNGQISLGTLPGAADVYAQQQGIGARTNAAYDLVPVPATGPNSPPTFRSRLDLLGGAHGAPGAPQATQSPTPGAVPPTAPNAAGMSPAVAAEQAAGAAQQQSIALNYGKMYNELQNASMTNPAKIANFQRIGTLLGDYEGGKLSKGSFELARLGNSLGLQIDKKLPNKEAAEALSSQVALELRSTAEGGGMPGSLSNQDRDYLKGMTPNMAQTAEGRGKIIETRVKLMQRESEISGMARKYVSKYKKLDAGFFDQLQTWADSHPIFK
jgi:hypothetical protein